MIFFDLDDTLLDQEAAVFTAAERFLEHYSADLPYALERFYDLWQRTIKKHADAYFRGEISWLDQRRYRIRDVFQEPDLSDSEADERFSYYLKVYEQSWVLFPDVIPCLDALREHRLGIITNGNVAQQTDKLEKLGIEERFEPIVISEAVGVAKPEREIFLEAARRGEVQPADCVYIGDRLDLDAQASCAAGMRGIWLQRNENVKPPFEVETIRDLHQLLMKLDL